MRGNRTVPRKGGTMKIYIDFDDILCETAKGFCAIVERMFGKVVPYEDVHFFDLKKSFDLTDDEYERMMIEGHRPEVLLAYEEIEGSTDTVRKWMAAGHDVYIITGRPASAYDPSRQWLDEHNLQDVKLYCVNKYGRDSFIKNSEFSIELDEFYKMHFDFAVEDSPSAFKHLAHLENLRVAVLDRPWNASVEFPNSNYHRCYNWTEIDEYLAHYFLYKYV